MDALQDKEKEQWVEAWSEVSALRIDPEDPAMAISREAAPLFSTLIDQILNVLESVKIQQWFSNFTPHFSVGLGACRTNSVALTVLKAFAVMRLLKYPVLAAYKHLCHRLSWVAVGLDPNGPINDLDIRREVCQYLNSSLRGIPAGRLMGTREFLIFSKRYAIQPEELEVDLLLASLKTLFQKEGRPHDTELELLEFYKVPREAFTSEIYAIVLRTMHSRQSDDPGPPLAVSSQTILRMCRLWALQLESDGLTEDVVRNYVRHYLRRWQQHEHIAVALAVHFRIVLGVDDFARGRAVHYKGIGSWTKEDTQVAVAAVQSSDLKDISPQIVSALLSPELVAARGLQADLVRYTKFLIAENAKLYAEIVLQLIVEHDLLSFLESDVLRFMAILLSVDRRKGRRVSLRLDSIDFRWRIAYGVMQKLFLNRKKATVHLLPHETEPLLFWKPWTSCFGSAVPTAAAIVALVQRGVGKEKKSFPLYHLPALVMIDLISSEEDLLSVQQRLKACSAVGLDAEWKPGSASAVHLLQLATPSAVFLIDLLQLATDGLQHSAAAFLRWLLEEESLQKVGHSLTRSDIPRLLETIALVDACPVNCQSIVEITSLLNISGKIGLNGLVKKNLGKCLDKGQQCSDWSHRPLTLAQKRYAAMDAFVLLELMPAKGCEEEKAVSEVASPDEVWRAACSVQLKVGVVLSCSAVKRSRKLIEMSIDVGGAEPIRMAAGIGSWITCGELMRSPRCVVVCNIAPLRMCGIRSEAGVLCAISSDRGTVALVQPPPEALPGQRALPQSGRDPICEPLESIRLQTPGNAVQRLLRSGTTDRQGVPLVGEWALQVEGKDCATSVINGLLG